MVRRILAMVWLLFVAYPCRAQWTLSYGECEVTSFGHLDTACFIGVRPKFGVDVPLYRYVKPQEWSHAFAAGLDRGAGSITSFASLGSRLFAAMNSGPVYASYDSGRSWITVLADGPVLSSNNYIFATADPTGTVPQIRRSVDGNSWQPVSQVSSPVTCFGAIGTCILAASASGVYRSTDTGASTTWQFVTTPVGRITAFATVDSILYATDGIPGWKTGIGHVIRSGDSGLHWTMISTPGFSVQCLASDGKHLFVSGADSLFMLDADRVSWSPRSDGLHSYSIVALGVFDTILFADIWPASTIPNYYLYSRSIPQMTAVPVARAEQEHSGRSVALYPNPASSVVLLDLGDLIVRKLELEDLLGQIRQTVIPEGPLTSLDLRQLAPGTYFVRLETTDSVVLRKVIHQ